MDTDRLALHSLEKLPGWSTDVRMEVHNRAFGGPLLDSIGNPQAPIRRVLTLNTDGQYQPYDDEGLQLYGATDLYTAILQALPDTQRNMLDIHIGQKGKLRQAIRDKPLERNELRTALSLQPIREPVVETLRLLGSNGYPRTTGEAPRTLQDRAREVYPGHSPDEIQALVQRLQSHPEGPRAELSRLRNEYFQLVNDLHVWANNPPRAHPETHAILSPQEMTAETQNRRLFREEIPVSYTHLTLPTNREV